MTGKSTYLEAAGLNWIRGAAMPAAPTAVYVGLFSADPTDAGLTTNEVTTAVRTAGRVAATFGAVSSSAGTSTIANSAAVSFGTAAGSASVTHFGIFDAQSGGNMLYSGTVASGGITAGGAVQYPIGSLTISEQ